MAIPTLDYFDAYLKNFVDLELEQRAQADVAEIGTFETPWPNRLTVLRAYIIICMEKQAEPEDLFTAKLKTYRAEFNVTLAQAQAAAAVVGEYGMFSVPILRA